ncbi:pyroglutamyl-peptidase I [Anaerobacillus alkaliphilus]|uniref:Pyroglutamyl-peptidase I n=1 Tax=Anaerobacillus alkaliphilus TaxID=1548597 RepID=A0A4Q0VPG6_9BACI|nr:pyroglutamyl-peptidase I [Anaerobacillus alkaliphilus]RXI98356.1 pyroglutamyl-peptidase I [Anaerobacillus alkaliphilus]
MKVLVTGFEPFGGMEVNPTAQLSQAISEDEINGIEIYSATLPVVYDLCVQQLLLKIEEISPDVVISCGLAFGRASVTIERIGINIKDTAGEGQKGDNQGDKPIDERIIPDGPDGLFSTLPIRTITTQLKQAGIPAQISNSAGTYICNNTLYGMLHYIIEKNLAIRAGFIHFPATPEMTVDKPNVASMAFETQLNALRTIVKSLAV